MYRCMSSGGLLSQGAVRLQCRLGSARQSFNALCKRVFHLVVEARDSRLRKASLVSVVAALRWHNVTSLQQRNSGGLAGVAPASSAREDANRAKARSAMFLPKLTLASPFTPLCNNVGTRPPACQAQYSDRGGDSA